MGVVYKITNLVNGKSYVGKTTQGAAYRWMQHKSHAKNGRKRYYLYDAMKKYGVDSFSVEVIDRADTPEDLDAKEIFWIAFLKTTDGEFGYNCTPGEEAAKHTPSARPRKPRGPLSPETRAKISAAHKGKKASPEEAARLRTLSLGRKQRYDEIEQRRKSNLLKWANKPEDEIRDHVRRTQESRKRNARPRPPANPEHLRLRGESLKRWWASPDGQIAKTKLKSRFAKNPVDRSKAWKTRRANGNESPEILKTKKKEWWSNPENVERVKSKWTPERKAAHGEAIRKRIELVVASGKKWPICKN